MGSEDVLTRPAPSPDAVLAYGEHRDQVADVWWPTSRADAEPTGVDADGAEVPLVVMVHGGCWRRKTDRAHVRPMCVALAGDGLVVAAAEYRRVGEGGAGGWPATFDDVAAIADRLPSLVAGAAMPTGLRLAPQHVLIGHSAGGHLVLWAAARHRLAAASAWHRARPDPSLAGVLALAPVSCLHAAAEQGVCGGGPQTLVGARPDAEAGRWAQADPVALLPTHVPTVIVHGTEDDVVPVALSHAYADAARGSGEAPDLRVLRGVDHFAIIDPLSQPWADVREALSALLGGAAVDERGGARGS